MKKKQPPKTGAEKRLETLNAETAKQKEELLAQLAKYPIIETACNRAGVGRSTYYSWRKKDHEFKKASDHAMRIGKEFINDMSESALIKNVQSGSNPAIFFWLKNHHGDYNEKIFHKHEVEVPKELDQKQVDAINYALHNIGLRSIVKMDKEMEERLEKAIDTEIQKRAVEVVNFRMAAEEGERKKQLAKEGKSQTAKSLEVYNNNLDNMTIKIGNKKPVNLKKFVEQREAEQRSQSPQQKPKPKPKKAEVPEESTEERANKTKNPREFLDGEVKRNWLKNRRRF